ncbi:MAG: hypothetical protein U0U70_04455 [Chitinophagaceae bacterium]
MKSSKKNYEKFESFFKKNRKIKDIEISDADKENDIQIQKSFLNQFAENQNHNQRLFIQFLSSVLIVITAYAYVYTNTTSSDGTYVYKTLPATVRDSSNNSQLSNPYTIIKIDSYPFSSVKNENGAILSYSQMTLLSIYLFAQIALLILSIMILHMGYSFRRDQVTVYRIRRVNLRDETYKNIFGGKSSMGFGKGFFEYLPNFNSILFFSICVIQIGLFISIFFYLNRYGSETFAELGETFVTPPYSIKYTDLSSSLFFPLFINLFLYTYYYNRYEFGVNQENTYVPDIIRIYNKNGTFILYFIIGLINMGILVYSFYQVDKYIHLWTIFYYLAIIQSSLVVYFLIDRVFKIKLSEYYAQLFLGIMYVIFGVILFFHSYYWFIELKSDSKRITLFSIYLAAFSTLLFCVPNWVSKKNNDVARYLYGYNRFVAILFYAFLIDYFMELKWLDYAVSGFFSLYSILIGRRIIIKWRNSEYDKLKRL